MPNLPENRPTGPFAGRQRRRRRVVVTGYEDPERATRVSMWALVGMAAIALYALFAAAAPLAVLHGGVWVAFGLLMVVCPPQVKLSRIWRVAGLALLAGASLALLPASWFGVPAWRTALEALGQGTGLQVTIQPRQTVELLAGLAVTVLAGWYLLGHRVSERGHLGLALGVALGIAGYAMVSIVTVGQTPRWAWDPMDNFGWFANRNHTATVLAMGALCGLGVLMEAVRSKRGGVAGLAALALAVCVWAVLGYSTSRAGLLLLLLGTMGWLVGLGASGTRYVSTRLLVTVLGFGLVAGVIFQVADTDLRKRLETAWAQLDSPAAPPAAGTATDSTQGESASPPFDFRQPIYRDTLVMLAREPLTGVGLGQFPAVFPQYREQSAIHAKCWHPESNWLMLAAEAGGITAGILALTVGGLFLKAFLAGRRHRGWPLTLGTLVAAAVVPVHGLFDVPGHHVGIAWLSLLLLALTFRREDAPAAPAGRVERALFRLAGVAVLLGGLMVFRSAGPDQTPPALLTARLTAGQVQARYARDLAEKSDPINHPPERRADGSAVDQLEVAQRLLNEALRTAPLDPELHYLRGLLSVNFSDEEAIADQAFAVQRLLEPDWVDVPWRQGLAWMTIDPSRSLDLWREAMRRAKLGESLPRNVYWTRTQLLDQIRNATKPHPELADLVAQLAAEAARGKPET